jgi:hypothetical protein
MTGAGSASEKIALIFGVRLNVEDIVGDQRDITRLQ